MMNTSVERVDALMDLSDAIYPVIDQDILNEKRYRVITRLGINAIGLALKEGKPIDVAGGEFLSIATASLGEGGLTIEDAVYDSWPEYRQYIQSLPSPQTETTTGLNDISNTYADVSRGTVDTEGKHETDARHAVHLVLFAVPYAMHHYPELNPRKVAVYCLLHDLIEAYTGDVPTLGISEEDHAIKILKEIAGLEQFRSDFQDEWAGLVNVIDSYETLEDKESRFTKTIDKIDPSFTHFQSKGSELINYYKYQSANHFISEVEKGTDRILSYGHPFTKVMDDRAEFIQRVARNVDWQTR